MEMVLALIGMSVGVAAGGTRVCVTELRVRVGARKGLVGEVTVGVDKILTEKLQASSTSVLNRNVIINGEHLRCFITFSLSAITHWNFQYETIIKRFPRASCSREERLNRGENLKFLGVLCWHVSLIRIGPDMRRAPGIRHFRRLVVKLVHIPELTGSKRQSFCQAGAFLFFHQYEWSYT
jgi:hypothetical protein